MHVVAVDRLPLGYFLHPESRVAKYPGVTIRSAVIVCGYLVRSGGTTGLFDTGIVADPEAAERFHPRAFDLDAALDRVGVGRDDIEWIANCHLHADHAGGNHLFPGVPVIVQRSELAASDHPDYTVRAAAVDYAGASLEVVDGEHTVAPGVRVVPTPGHSPGHQSMLVDATAGTTLLAGQAFDTATEYALADLATRLPSASDEFTYPDWMPSLVAADPAVVHLAHDLASWHRLDRDLPPSAPAPVFASESDDRPTAEVSG
jgi:glyoxylase-like metal-dependent hydrolase (beta-lactamase superfamily II)